MAVNAEESKTEQRSQQIEEKLKEQKEKWDGVGLFKFLKVSIIGVVVLVGILELFLFVWPRVEHFFPERISTEEKCKKAECDKSCNGMCTCTYVNKFNKNEQVSCLRDGK